MDAPRLFAKLYLDEDVSVRVADILQGHEYGVRTAHEEGMLGTSDAEQLALATVQERCALPLSCTYRRER